MGFKENVRKSFYMIFMMSTFNFSNIIFLKKHCQAISLFLKVSGDFYAYL